MDRKILIVDDEPAIRDLLADFLAGENFKAFTASNGTDALKIVNEHKPPLVLLDLSLGPENGLNILQIIKKGYPEIFVIILSGGQDEEKAKEAIQLGAYDYVSKPVSLRRLVEDFVERIFI